MGSVTTFGVLVAVVGGLQFLVRKWWAKRASPVAAAIGISSRFFEVRFLERFATYCALVFFIGGVVLALIGVVLSVHVWEAPRMETGRIAAILGGSLVACASIALLYFRIIRAGAVTLRQQQRLRNSGVSAAEITIRARESSKLIVAAIGWILIAGFMIASGAGWL